MQDDLSKEAQKNHQEIKALEQTTAQQNSALIELNANLKNVKLRKEEKELNKKR